MLPVARQLEEELTGGSRVGRQPVCFPFDAAIQRLCMCGRCCRTGGWVLRGVPTHGAAEQGSLKQLAPLSWEQPLVCSHAKPRCLPPAPAPPAGDANAGLKGLVKEHSSWLASNCQRQLANYRWVAGRGWLPGVSSVRQRAACCAAAPVACRRALPSLVRPKRMRHGTACGRCCTPAAAMAQVSTSPPASCRPRCCRSAFAEARAAALGQTLDGVLNTELEGLGSDAEARRCALAAFGPAGLGPATVPASPARQQACRCRACTHDEHWRVKLFARPQAVAPDAAADHRGGNDGGGPRPDARRRGGAGGGVCPRPQDNRQTSAGASALVPAAGGLRQAAAVAWLLASLSHGDSPRLPSWAEASLPPNPSPFFCRGDAGGGGAASRHQHSGHSSRWAALPPQLWQVTARLGPSPVPPSHRCCCAPPNPTHLLHHTPSPPAPTPILAPSLPPPLLRCAGAGAFGVVLTAVLPTTVEDLLALCLAAMVGCWEGPGRAAPWLLGGAFFALHAV